jgi:hypothetical protein
MGGGVVTLEVLLRVVAVRLLVVAVAFDTADATVVVVAAESPATVDDGDSPLSGATVVDVVATASASFTFLPPPQAADTNAIIRKTPSSVRFVA